MENKSTKIKQQQQSQQQQRQKQQMMRVDLAKLEVLDCPHAAATTTKSDMGERKKLDVMLIRENGRPVCAVFYCSQCSGAISEYIKTRSAKLDLVLLRAGKYNLEEEKEAAQ